MKIRVLFICVHNSARSQMAAAWLKCLAPDHFEVDSAGLQPGSLNPLAVTVMGEAGIDISHNRPKSVLEVLGQNKKFDYVITVCDESQAENCPVFPGNVQRLHWSFPDPSRLIGTESEKIQKTRVIRDKIKNAVADWIHGMNKNSFFRNI